MPWVKLDDKFPEHRKIAEAGPLAMAMQVAALCYANRSLTDGFIPTRVAAGFMPMVCFDPETGDETNWRAVAKRLVAAGVWSEVEGGFRIHDYLEYQPSKAHVDDERKKTAERVAAWRERKKDDNEAETDDEPECNAECNGVTNGGVTPAPEARTRSRTQTLEPVKGKERPAPFGEDSPPYQLAQHLRAAILNRDPTTKVPDETPEALKGWSSDADKLLRIDKRPLDEAANLVEWCQKDEFWSANVLSMSKFRKQYDKLKRQAARGHPKGRLPNGETPIDEFLREVSAGG